MSKNTNQKLERRMWTKQQSAFLLECIKRRSDIIESDQNDAFTRNAKTLAWKDVQSQLFKRFQLRCDVLSLKTKWAKMKYAAKRKACEVLSKGQELASSDWSSKVLGIAATNAEADGLSFVGNDEDNLSMNGETLFSIEYPGGSHPHDDDLLAAVQNNSETSSEAHNEVEGATTEVRLQPKVEMDIEQSMSNGHYLSQNEEAEVSFRRQLYEGTLERLEQEHQLKMELLRVKCEGEKVKLEMLRIQRDEAQRRADGVKNERRAAEQWFAQTANHTDDFNHFTIND